MADPFFEQILSQFTDPYEEMNRTATQRLELIPGLRDELRTKRQATYENSPEEYGNMIGSFLLPALAGTVSNDWQTGLNWGTRVSGGLMQDLASREAEQRKLIDDDISLLDQEQSFLRNSIEGNSRAKASAGNQLGLSYLTGNVVGSAPYEQERADQLAAQKELFSLRSQGQAEKQEGVFDPAAVAKSIGLDGVIRPDAPPLSASEVQAATSMKTAMNSDESLKNRINQAASKLLSSGIPGFVTLPGFSAPAEKIDKIREMDSFRRAAIGSLDELEKMMVERQGQGLEPIDFGAKAPLFEMLAKQVVPWSRTFGGTGAALTGTGRAGEISQLASMTPAGADSLSQDGIDFITRKLKGQDPSEFVRDLRRTILQRTADRAFSYNIYDPEMRDLYNERERATIEALAPEYGLDTPWGRYVDILKQTRQGNPVFQQQQRLTSPQQTTEQVTDATQGQSQPVSEIPPIRYGMKQFKNNATGERKLFWVDQKGNRIAEVQ